MCSSLSLLDLRYEDQTMGSTHTSALLTADRLSLISPAQSISNGGVLFRGTKGHFEQKAERSLLAQEFAEKTSLSLKHMQE